MKRIFLLTCLPLCLCLGGVPVSALAAGGVKLVRVWPEYRGDSALLRLSDYFHHNKRTSGSDYQRTDPAARAGLYFIVRLKSDNSKSIADGIARLHVIVPDASEPRTFDFPFRAHGKFNLKLELGLTGSDWTYGNMLPTAWRLEILNGANTVVGSHNSFLWQ